MRGLIGGTLIGGALLLAACGNPVSSEVREQAAAERAARDACYEAAGFTVAVNSPPPADGGNRNAPRDAIFEHSIQAPDGTWLDLYHWNEWTNEPNHAEEAAVWAVDEFNQQAYPNYGDARAVGRRAYVPVAVDAYAPYDALDACLMMP